LELIHPYIIRLKIGPVETKKRGVLGVDSLYL
jgi:hypothetical protein